MANTEIDSLSLDIQITGLNPDDLKNLDKLSKAVARLSKALSEADFSKLEKIQVPKGIKSLQLITQNFKPGSVVNGEDLKYSEEQLEKFDEKFSEIVETTSDLDLKMEAVGGTIKTTFITGKKTADDLGNSVDNARKKMGRIEKLFKRFKTILFIKAIRELINAVVQAVKQGIKNLALFDSSFNDTISKITTASTNIKNSLALTFRPLIETIQPLIQSISIAFVNLGNSISKAQASMKGLSEYTKISAKYMEDYAKSQQKSSLFKFDTFNTIDTGSNMFEEETISDDEAENTNAVAELLIEIQEFIGNILKTLGKIFNIVGRIIKDLAPALTSVLEIVNGLFDIIIDILDALNPLFDSIFNDLLPPLINIVTDVLQPILQIVKTVTPLVTMIVNLIASILSPVISSIGSSINAIEPIISVIATIVSFIVDLLGTSLVDGLNFVLTLLQPIVDAIQWISDTFGVFMEAIHDLFNADFEGFANKIVLFFKKAFWGLVKLLASMIDSTINAIIEGINTIFLPLNKLSEWFEWGWEIGITWRSNLADLVPSYANGGFVGELWQMNEYGNPEMLYNANNNGNTAVINQQQLSLAFEQAIYNTGLLDVIAQAGVINIDGRAIAQSTNFKNEINRTNPELNIR